MGCQVCGGVPVSGIEPDFECENGHRFCVHQVGARKENVNYCPICGDELSCHSVIEEKTEANTVLKWWEENSVQHRIQVFDGAGRWTIIRKDSRGPGGSWTNDWARKATDKPIISDL